MIGRVDLEIARRGFRRSTAYPAAVAAGIFTNSVFGFVKGSILLAVIAYQPVVGGYDRLDALTFAWISQALMVPTVMFMVWDDLAVRIRTGDVATDLVRPIHLLRYHLAYDLGRAWSAVIFRGVPPFLVGWFAYDLRVPTSPSVWSAFGLSAVLAVVASLGFRFAYNCVGFWTLDIRGIGLLALLAANVASGFLVPLTFFPPAWEDVLRLLPFAGMIQTPADVFLGHLDGSALVGALALQAGWAVVLLVAAAAALRLGTRRVVVQGG